MVVDDEPTPEEIEAAKTAPQFHSALNKVLDTLPVNGAKKLEIPASGVARIKSAVSAFNSRSGKKFIVRVGADGHALAIRIS
jgi:hypothetical protein